MARTFAFKCDGCDTTEVMSNDQLPLNWKELHIKSLEQDRYGDKYEDTYHWHLCSPCAKKMNPSKWERAARVGN